MAKFLAIKSSHCHMVMMGSWCSSISNCKAIIRSANHIHYVPRVITAPGYQIICIVKRFGYSALPFRYALLVSSISFMFVGGHKIGSALVDVSGIFLCHFNLFI